MTGLAVAGLAPRPVTTLSGVPTDLPMQSFAPEPVTGQFYVTQARPGDTGKPEDLRIYRVGTDGAVLDYALIKGGGHGTQLALEHDAGRVVLWWFHEGLGKVVRWPYSPGDVPAAGSPSMQTLTNLEPRICYFSLDEPGGLVATSYLNTGDNTFQFTLRSVADYRAGRNTILRSFTIDAAIGTYQGHATAGNNLLLFLSTGTGGATSIIVNYDWATGTEIDRVDVTTAVPADQQDGRAEAEGVAALVNAAGVVIPMFGISTGTVGLRTNHLFQLLDPATTPGAGDTRTIDLQVRDFGGATLPDAEITASYDRPVATTAGATYPRFPGRPFKLADKTTLEVFCSDAPGLTADSQGVGFTVTIAWTNQDGKKHTAAYPCRVTTLDPQVVSLAQARQPGVLVVRR